MPKALVIPTKGIALSPYQNYVQADFTAGLVMERGGDMDPKATKFCLNVDQFPQGGFGSRKGLGMWAVIPSVAIGMAGTLAKFETTEGRSFLMIGCDNGDLYYSEQGPGVPIYGVTGGTSGQWPRGIEANYSFYIQWNATKTARKWNGTGAAVDLLDAFTHAHGTGTDGTRTGGTMPICRYMVFYHQRMFCFWTNESGVMHPNRVRWSYPTINGEGLEDFRSDTWVDIEDGADGDEIVGALAHGPSMFIFKRNSIFHAEGFDETDVSFLPLNLSSGAVAPDAIVNAEDGIFFWDASKGLCQIQRAPVGSDSLYNVTQLSFQLGQLLLDGTIPLHRLWEVTLGLSLGEVKVYCSVPWGKEEKRTLVYNRVLKSWTLWDCSVAAHLLYRPARGRPAAVACARYVGFGYINTPPGAVLEMEATEDALDDLWNDRNTRVLFPARYRTAFDGLGVPFGQKQVDMLEFVCAGTGAFEVVVSRDFDTGAVVGSLAVNLPGNPEANLFDLGGHSDVTGLDYFGDTLAAPLLEVLYPGAPATEMRCNPDQLGAVLSTPMQIAGGRVGVPMFKANFRSIQLDIIGPTTGVGWRIYAINFKFFSKTRTT